jgi:biopolymer transport protein ExbB
MIRALEQTSDELLTRRMRQIEILNVIGNVAPMIGLFGTVYGMILTFQGIVASGGRPDPVDLAGGIGTALTTTFWGLIVAIPSLAGYAIIRNNIDSLTSEATLQASELVSHFKPVAGQASTAAGAAAAATSASASATPSSPTSSGSSSPSLLSSAVSSTARLRSGRVEPGGTSPSSTGERPRPSSPSANEPHA